MTRKHQGWMAGLAVGSLALWSTQAAAQQAEAAAEAAEPSSATAAPAASASSDDIETVVVTARRRAESLAKVPTSITALGAQQLEERGIVSQSDLQAAVPGLTVRQTQGSNSLTFSIRGQTIDAFTGSRSAVVPYFNDVQLNTGGASTLFDLESIQVLKGPQGTLFGRNTTGGAVLYTSARPKEELGGYLTLRSGSYGLLSAQGAFNAPLFDNKLLLRLAADVTHQDGWQENLYDGRDLGEVDRQSGRLSALWKPSAAVENLTVLQVDHAGGNSTATRLRTVNRVNPATFGCVDPNVVNCASDLLFSPLVDAVYSYPGMWAAYTAAHPNLNPGGIAAYLDNDSPNIGFWKANEAAPLHHNGHDYFASNTTTIDLGNELVLKNIAGLSISNTRDLGSSVGAPFPVFYSATLALDGTGAAILDADGNVTYREKGNRVQNRTISEELQLQGKAFDQSLTYIVGAYYQYEKSKTLFPQVYFDFSPIVAGSNAASHFEITDETPALFAQSTYDFSSLGAKGLSLTTGVRYTWERVEIRQLPGADNLNDPAQPASQRKSFSNPSWTLGLSWQATDEWLMYLQGRRSWRAGGYNGTAPAAIDPGAGAPIIENTNLFEPERTYDIEGGVKYAGSAFGRPLRMNLAVYNQWIKDVQRAEFPDPPGPASSIAYTVNVPEARVTGAEFDATFRPARWLETGVSGALTYARFIDGKNTADVFGTTYVFGPYADVPRSSGTVYTTVFLPTPAEWGAMDLRADLYGQSYMYFSNNNNTITPDTRIHGYGLINLRYGWSEMFGSKFSLAAYVRNLTDREYYTGGFALTGSLGVNSVAVGTPRMFGAEVRYEF